MLEKIKKILLLIFWKKKIILNLPNRWQLNYCFDCETKLNKNNFSGWEAFRIINGKEWSVKVCNKCLEKQEKALLNKKINVEKNKT